MKRLALVTVAMMGVLLALFAIAQAADIDLLVDPRPVLSGLGEGAAVLAVALLIADVVLPVPSSVIMVWLGASQGWVLGGALSLAGSVGAAAFAFWIGRRGGPTFERLVPAAERARADAFLGRWGVLAIALTRAVPIVAETIAIVAGASPAMRWRGAMTGALVGCAPWAVGYGLAGAALVA